jgi:hypothetical protein
VICLVIHPGVLDTELSRPYHKNIKPDDILSTEFSACRWILFTNLTNLL